MTEDARPTEEPTGDDAAASAPVGDSKPPRLFGQLVSPDHRAHFDSVAASVGCINPTLLEASEALVVTDETDSVHAIGYLGIRHILGPFTLSSEASPQALTCLADTAAAYLRDIVRETVAAQTRSGNGADNGTDSGDGEPSEPSPVTTPHPLSYDMYVPDGAEPPLSDGFELLPVRVWRRRVV